MLTSDRADEQIDITHRDDIGGTDPDRLIEEVRGHPSGLQDHDRPRRHVTHHGR